MKAHAQPLRPAPVFDIDRNKSLEPTLRWSSGWLTWGAGVTGAAARVSRTSIDFEADPRRWVPASTSRPAKPAAARVRDEGRSRQSISR